MMIPANFSREQNQNISCRPKKIFSGTCAYRIPRIVAKCIPRHAISVFNGAGVFMDNECIMNKSTTCLPQRIMTEELKQPLTKTKICYEGEEERKIAENISAKLFNPRSSGEFASTENATPELIDFTKEEINLEESTLQKHLTSLKKEHSRLMLEESFTGSAFSDLQIQKLGLDACRAEEFAARGQIGGLITSLQEMLLETRYARKEEENEMKFMTKELKKQTEAANSYLSKIENELGLALQETEESKSSEARILDQIRAFSEKAIPDPTPELITIPEEEFEYLIQRTYKTDAITEMKVAAARDHIEEAKGSEHNALKELKRRRKQIEDSQAIIDLASKRVQAAEAAKKALRKQHKSHQNKPASKISSGTEAQTYPLIKTKKRNLIAPQIKIKEHDIASGYGLCLP